MSTSTTIVWFGAALACSFLVTLATRAVAPRVGMVDRPGPRSSHSRPTATGGGLGIVLVTLAGLLVWAIVVGAPLPPFLTAAWFVGALLLGVTSATDDARGLPVGFRLAMQVLSAAAFAVALQGVGGAKLHPLVPGVLGWPVVVVSVVWVVGIANAFNFMDGIDGIAASQAVVAGCGWWAVARLAGVEGLGVVALLVVSTSLGFLILNRPPASIFMGDVGSIFLGYLFATLTVGAGVRDPRLALVGALLMWPFIADTGWTLLRRALRGEALLRAHREHIYQRLVGTGLGHGVVSLAYALLSLGGGLAAVGWYSGLIGSLLTPLVLVGLLFLCLLCAVRLREAASRA